MAEKDFHVSLPQEVVGGFGWNEAEVPSRVREALVMDLLRLDRLSEAQAAAILALARWELLELMGRYDVPALAALAIVIIVATIAFIWPVDASHGQRYNPQGSCSSVVSRK